MTAMSFDGLLVNHAALEAASSHLLTTASRIDERLNGLESELNVLRDSWTGSAQVSYQGAKTTWDRAIAEVIGLLQEASALVQNSNAEYRAADLRGAARFE